jgi:hypothetical protein
MPDVSKILCMPDVSKMPDNRNACYIVVISAVKLKNNIL